MGIFSKKKKPFYQLSTRAEIEGFFAETKPWKALPRNVITKIIDRFIEDKSAFEIFVYISEHCNLITNNYIPLCSDTGLDLAITGMASTLYNTGAMHRDELLRALDDHVTPEKQKKALLEHAKMSFEAAMHIDPGMTCSACYQLAFLWGQIEGDRKKGLAYCMQGLHAVPADDSEMREQFIVMREELQ